MKSGLEKGFDSEIREVKSCFGRKSKYFFSSCTNTIFYMTSICVCLDNDSVINVIAKNIIIEQTEKICDRVRKI